MSVLFAASLILFLVAEVSSATKLFSTNSVLRPATMAVWCFVPLLIVSILLWNHYDIFVSLHETRVTLTQFVK